MSNFRDQERPRKRLHVLGLGLAACSLIVWSATAQAAAAPESFSGLAKEVTPAVVNIASVHTVNESGMQMPDLPFNFPEGSPFEKFFKDFRDRMGQQNGGHGQPHTMAGVGSGFIIDPAGYVVTNNHVVDGSNDVQVRLDDDSVYPAKVIGVDAKTDLALLKIDAHRPLPSVAFGDSDKAEVGDWVMAVGNPFGLGGTVTAGIISARGRNIDAGPYDDFLQIDAPINRGNSGGPLFNMDGQVIGVNSAIYSPNGGSVGIGFAIPASMAKNVVEQLKDTGKVERGWLGVQIQGVTPEIASAVNLKDAHGAMVTQVTPDSPAERAGLKQGDIIVGFEGQTVADPRGLARVVAQQPAGEKAHLAVWRDGREKSLNVVIGQLPDQSQMASAESRDENSDGYHAADLGADLATLTPARRAEFNVGDDVAGVLVLDVKSNPVFEQGLRPGDVIKQVGPNTVSSPQEVEKLVSKAKAESERSVLVLISRDGHDLYLGLKLGLA